MNRQCACTYAIEPTGLIQPVGAPTQASETAGSAPVKIDAGSYPHIPHITKKTQNFRSMVDPTSQEIGTRGLSNHGVIKARRRR